MRLRAAIFLVLAIVAAVIPASAVEGYRSIVLECKLPPGRKVSIQLDASLSVRYDYGMMELAGSKVFVQIPLDNVKSWRFSKDATDGVVGAPDAAAEQIGVDIRRQRVAITGISGPTLVALYDMAGVQIVSETVHADHVVSLEGLPPGFYVLVAGDNTFKLRID